MALRLVLTLALGVSPQQHRASVTFTELQRSFWSETSGIWRSSMWWQSANTVEVLANLGLASQSDKPEIERVLAAVFNATSDDTIARCDKKVDLTFSGYFDDELWWGIGWLRAYVLTGEFKYLNRSRFVFDDIVNRSWCNASCQGGVCWQAARDPKDMGKCYKNAITNELFLSLGAQLTVTYSERCNGARRRMKDATAALWPESHLPPDCAAAAYTASWAQTELEWFLNSGMINKSSLVNDGLDTFDTHQEVCLSKQDGAYSYNQGVILSGLGLLWAQRQKERQPEQQQRWSVVAAGQPAAVSDADLLRLAASIVEAVWSSPFVYNESGGVLRDLGEPLLVQGTVPNLYEGSPGTDGLQFKGILVRHMRYLIDAVLHASGGSEDKAQAAVAAAGGNLSQWRARITRNAEAIWENAACARELSYSVGAALEVPALFGYRFLGPCAWAFGGPSATTQTQALDVFVAAIF